MIIYYQHFLLLQYTPTFLVSLRLEPTESIVNMIEGY